MYKCKAYKRAQPESDSQQGSDAAGGGENAEKDALQSWRNDFKGYSRRAVEVAAERGTFAALRLSFLTSLYFDCVFHFNTSWGKCIV